MKFDSLDVIHSRPDYLKAFKKIFAGLNEGELVPFWYYDDVKIGADEAPVLVFGPTKPDVLKALKSESSMRGEGNCFRERGSLKLTLVSGRAPEPKLKTLFREMKTIGYAMVEADLTPGDVSGPGRDDASRAKEIVAQLIARFDEGKSKISDEGRKKLRNRMDAIDAAAKPPPDMRKLESLVAGFDKALAAFLAQGGKAAPAEASPEQQRAEGRAAAAMARFDKAKAKLTDDERKQVRAAWAAVDAAREAKDWSALVKAADAADVALATVLKAKLAAERGSATGAEQTIDAKIGAAANALRGQIATQTAALDKLRASANPERAKLAKLLDAMQLRRRKLAEVQKDPARAGEVPAIEAEINTLLGPLNTSKGVLQGIEAQLKTEHGKLAALEAKLAKLKRDTDPESVKTLEAAEKAMVTLERLLDDVPFAAAAKAIEAVVGEMAEATKWHEEQIKREAAAEAAGDKIRPHIAGRHGPQTGLGRQGRRAGTSAHVTPDQPGNNAGAPQVLDWHKVKITYTDLNGKRVVKDRQKVAQLLVAQMTRGGGGNVSSLWATPVLEKEAVDRASDYAQRLAGFTHYLSNSGQNEFKSLTIVLGKPQKQPGWGYQVKNTSGTYVTPATADDILKDFEAGKITQDEMLKKMDVELVTVDGGAKMVEFCRMIFRRNDINSGWTLLTGYPDSADREGFSPHQNFLNNLRLVKADGSVVTIDGTNLGAIP